VFCGEMDFILKWFKNIVGISVKISNWVCLVWIIGVPQANVFFICLRAKTILSVSAIYVGMYTWVLFCDRGY